MRVRSARRAASSRTCVCLCAQAYPRIHVCTYDTAPFGATSLRERVRVAWFHENARVLDPSVSTPLFIPLANRSLPPPPPFRRNPRAIGRCNDSLRPDPPLVYGRPIPFSHPYGFECNYDATCLFSLLSFSHSLFLLSLCYSYKKR